MTKGRVSKSSTVERSEYRGIIQYSKFSALLVAGSREAINRGRSVRTHMQGKPTSLFPFSIL